MKPIRLISIIMILVSLIGGGILFYYYAQDSANTDAQWFQIIGIASIMLFICGIALAVLSKIRPDFLDMFSKKKNEPVITETPIAYVNAPTMSVQAKVPEVAAIPPEPIKELSFEEEMAFRKKQYYASEATKQIEASVIEKAATPPTHSSSPPSPAPSKPIEKVTLKFGFPAKKKVDPLREILDREEQSALREENSSWRSL